MTIATIERHASALLNRAGITEPPVPVDLIARRMGIDVQPAPLGQDVSGILVINDKGGTIGYNPSNALVRRRFTIAHELGHFLLHQNYKQLFIDKGFAVAFRDTRSSKGEFRRERQANAFAAALLMPKAFLMNEIKNREFDLADETTLDELAKCFQVSRQAMTFRLANCGLFSLDEL